MPLYEYRCEKCGQLFEVIQKFADKPLTTHEICGGTVDRLLSAPALQFKGSGFYINDYAKGSNANGGNSGKGESSGKSGESSGKSGESGKGESGKGESSGKSGESSSGKSSESRSSGEKSGSSQPATTKSNT